MNVIEFHPDDLLDREIAGTLSPVDRRRLRDHIARCPECQLERQLRSDFQAELNPSEKPANLQTLVSGALREARPYGSRRPSRAVGANAWRRRFVILLAATMVLATGLAAAEEDLAGNVWHAARERVALMLGSRSLRAVEVGVPRVKPVVPARTRAATEEHPIVAAPAPLVPEEGPSFVGTDLASTNLAGALVDERKEVRLRSVLRAKIEAPPVEASPQTDEVTAPTPIAENLAKALDSAPSLFDAAGTARRQGNTAEAARLYRDLEVRFAESPEARLSIAVMARMQLDIGEASASAAGFAAYLATGDRALREEATAGRALALGRLGRTADEVETWRELLHAYPASSYAKFAQSRLEQSLP